MTEEKDTKVAPWKWYSEGKKEAMRYGVKSKLKTYLKKILQMQ